MSDIIFGTSSLILLGLAVYQTYLLRCIAHNTSVALDF